MPTRAGWTVATAAITAIVAGRLLGLVEMYVLGGVALALVVVAVLSVRRRLPQLEVERTLVPARVHRGGDSHVDLVVVNEGRRRTQLLSLHDPVEGTVGAHVSLAPLDPGSTQTARYTLPTQRRGLLHIGPLQARFVDPFGLASRRREVAGRTHLTVLPSIEILDRLPEVVGVDDPLEGSSRPTAGPPGGGEFATLRGYVPGDDLRRVHWPSSARAGDLLVRLEDPLWQGHMTLVLEARATRISSDDFEHAVTGAASIVHAVSRAGDRIRLVVTDGTDSGSVDARAARETLLEMLAVVDTVDSDGPLPRPPLDGRRGTGALVLITGRLTPEDAEELDAAGTHYGSVLVITLDRATGASAEDSFLDDFPGIAVASFGTDEPFARAWNRYARQGRR
ncbi:MAG: DUF58 domain-containing protein [Acidimicrobiales bacterium]|nr:DUF58 domain-containing protein [Acidimicrobiales bacterium]